MPDSQNSGGTESIIPGVINIDGFPCWKLRRTNGTWTICTAHSTQQATLANVR